MEEIVRIVEPGGTITFAGTLAEVRKAYDRLQNYPNFMDVQQPRPVTLGAATANPRWREPIRMELPNVVPAANIQARITY